MTPGENQRLGTVNNCNCQFFAKHHSACKHMFLVARQTKYRVSKRVDHDNIKGAGTGPVQNNQTQTAATPAPLNSSFNIIPNIYSNTDTQANTNFAPRARQPPSEHTAQQSREISTSLSKSLPNFSLQSYLDMVHTPGNTNKRGLANANRWAHHLLEEGILKLDQKREQESNNIGPILTTRHPHPFTSTPLDPAVGPAEELDVYWDHLRRYLPLGQCHQKTLTQIHPIVPTARKESAFRNVDIPTCNSTDKTITNQPNTHPDITEEIVESTLPANFRQNINCDALEGSQSTRSTSAASESTPVYITTTQMERKGKLDKIWQSLITLNRIQCQKNYNRAANKWTIEEIDNFKEKVEGWVKEYRDFVDNGVTRKQPRFWEHDLHKGDVLYKWSVTASAKNFFSSHESNPPCQPHIS